MTPTEPSDLAARAAAKHVVVIGGGIGGLVAARECAKVGMRVTLFEASAAPGGAIRRVELDGVSVDAGAESYATRGGQVRALVEELGLAERIVTPQAGGAWLAGIPGVGAAPLPLGGILGIPANPFQDDVRRIIGWSGVWRAYLDRVRPPLTIGHQLSLGKLVASRMGAKVRDRLVAPVTSGVYSASPDDIDIDVAAPGLNAALTRVGSLSGAVQTLRAEAAAGATETPGAAKAPGAAVEGLRGGMTVLVDALVADLVRLGGEVRTGIRVRTVAKAGKTWTVEHETAVIRAVTTGATESESDADADADSDTDSDTDSDADSDALDAEPPGAELVAAEVVAAERAVERVTESGAEPVVEQMVEQIVVDAVIMATPESEARSLLATAVPALKNTAIMPSPEIEIVTLLFDSPELDVVPRGSGVLTVPGSHTAKALTHLTAKWGWLREAAGTRHVVRVSFGAQGEPAATAELSDGAAADLARREAAALLGTSLASASLIASHRCCFVQSQPASIIGAGSRRAAARAALQAVPGVAAVGAWLAGTGLAQVIPDARDEAERLRRTLLWG